MEDMNRESLGKAPEQRGTMKRVELWLTELRSCSRDNEVSLSDGEVTRGGINRVETILGAVTSTPCEFIRKQSVMAK